MNTAMAINSAQSEFIGGSNTNPPVEEAGTESVDYVGDSYRAETGIVCRDMSEVREKIHSLLVKGAVQTDETGRVDKLAYLVAQLERDDRKVTKGFDMKAFVLWVNQYTRAHIMYDSIKKSHIVEFRESKETRLKDAPKWYNCSKQKGDWSGEWDAKAQVSVLLSQHSKKSIQRNNLLKEGRVKEAGTIALDSDLMRAIKACNSDRRIVDMVLKTMETIQ